MYSTTFLCWWERPCLIYCHFQVPVTSFLTNFALLNSLLRRAKNGFLPGNITEQVWMDHPCFCGLSTTLYCSVQKFWWPLWGKKQTKILLKRKKKFSKTKHKSNVQKQSGDNKNAILWTPLLTPFAQIDMFGPKRLGFLLYGERVERNLMGHIMVLVGCLVGSLLSNLNGLWETTML